MKRTTKVSLSIITLILTYLCFFSSCEKEALEEPNPELEQKQLMQRPGLDLEAENIAPIVETMEMELGNITPRSNSQSIYSTSGSVPQGQIWAVYLPASAMQVGYKYTAVVTPTTGDPDLYIYRYSPWKYLRKSTNGSNTYDISHVSQEDMLAGNNRGYFIVYGYSAANFNFEIFKEPLYPTAHIGDDYPFDGQNSLCHSTNGCTPDPWGMCEDNCTSWVAWKINQANGFSQTNLSPQSAYPFYNTMTGANRLSNAHKWDERLSSIGIAVDNTPTPGSICNWEATSSNSAGHVAYVHAVSYNGTITISEYNYIPSCEYNTRIISPSNSNYPDHFIHVEQGL